MARTMVEIQVDENTARRYESLPLEDRVRLQEVMALLLRMAARTPDRTAVEIAREASLSAQEKGLNPEILDELIRG